MAVHSLREVDEQIIELLRDHRGEFHTAEIIAAAIDYSESYVRDRSHMLVDRDDTDVESQRTTKEVYGIRVGGGFEAISDDREHLLDIVRRHEPSAMGKATAMTNDELRSFITNEVADEEITMDTDKLYFGIPA